MKNLLLALLILFCGCSMIEHEAEREMKKEINRFLDSEFERYANKHHAKQREAYKDKITWGLGLVGGTLGVVATAGGLVILNRKLKKKNENI